MPRPVLHLRDVVLMSHVTTEPHWGWALGRSCAELPRCAGTEASSAPPVTPNSRMCLPDFGDEALGDRGLAFSAGPRGLPIEVRPAV